MNRGPIRNAEDQILNEGRRRRMELREEGP